VTANQEKLFFSFIQEISSKKADEISMLLKESQIVDFKQKIRFFSEVKSQAFVETFNAINRINNLNDKNNLLRTWFESVKNSHKNFTYEQTKYLLNHIFILSNFEMTDE